jgi:YggT family protein
VNLFTCDLARVLLWAVNIYTIVLFVYALLSWIPDLRGRWLYYLAAIVEPVLVPVRRIIPPIGGLDLAFLVVLLILQLLIRPAIGNLVVNSCYRLF